MYLNFRIDSKICESLELNLYPNKKKIKKAQSILQSAKNKNKNKIKQTNTVEDVPRNETRIFLHRTMHFKKVTRLFLYYLNIIVIQTKEATKTPNDKYNTTTFENCCLDVSFASKSSIIHFLSQQKYWCPHISVELSIINSNKIIKHYFD